MSRREHALTAAISAALEALGSGDQRGATSILLSVLEDAPLQRHECPFCGLRCRWPGELDNHLANVHHRPRKEGS